MKIEELRPPKRSRSGEDYTEKLSPIKEMDADPVKEEEQSPQAINSLTQRKLHMDRTKH